MVSKLAYESCVAEFSLFTLPMFHQNQNMLVRHEGHARDGNLGMARWYRVIFLAVVSLGLCDRVVGEALDCVVSSSRPVPDATVTVVFSIPKSAAAKAGTQKPAGGSAVAANTAMTILEETTYTTDEIGRYRLVLPELKLPELSVSMKVEHPDFLTRRLSPTTVQELRKQRHSTHRRTLLKRAHTVNGRALFPNGKPAVGATVVAKSKYRAYSWKIHFPGEYSHNTTTITDEDGSFSVQTDRLTTFRISLPGHPTLLVDSFEADAKPATEAEQDSVPTTMFQIPSPKIVRGRVSTGDGKPIPFAIVSAVRKFVFSESNVRLRYGVTAIADEHGRYELPPLAKDDYVFKAHQRFTDAHSAQQWQKRKPSPFTFASTAPNDDVIELDEIIVDKTLNIRDAESIVNLEADGTRKVAVRVQWTQPHAENGSVFLQPQGLFRTKWWLGRAKRITENGSLEATLMVPHGVVSAQLSTESRLVRFQRGPDQPKELGECIPLNATDDDQQVTVFAAPTVDVTINVELPKAILEKQRSGTAVDFFVFYANKGYRNRSRFPQTLFVRGTKIGDKTFEGQVLVGEEIVFQVKPRFRSDVEVLHEQRVHLETATPRVVNIRAEDLDLSRIGI